VSISCAIHPSVAFAGAKPKDEFLTSMDANPQCLKQHGGKPPKAETVVINEDGTLSNVFVWVKSGPLPASVPASSRAKLDQVNSLETLLGFEEVAYMALFGWLAVSGPGPVSLDALLQRLFPADPASSLHAHSRSGYPARTSL